MSDIQVSIYGSCNRPHLWQLFYDTLIMNKVKFEVIFVGNVEPTFTLPDNFHFIYSNVKPVQCEYIAATLCTGEVLQGLADDCHNSPNALDILYSTYKKQNDYKCIVAPKYIGVVEPVNNVNDIQKMVDKMPVDNIDLHLVYTDFNSLPVHVGGIMSNQFFKELGGHDKRFILGYADLDIQVRAQMSGGRILFDENVWIAERKDLCPNWREGITKKYTLYGNDLLTSLWFRNGTKIQSAFTGKRASEVQYFEENDILLNISQGPKGEWD